MRVPHHCPRADDRGDDAERTREEKLGPVLAEVMGGPPPEGGAPQYFPIDVLVIQR
jgi:hypothetical protein